MRYRSLFTLSGIVAFGLLATGCGTSNKSATPSPTAQLPQVRVWRVGQDSDLIKDQAREFMSTYKNAVQVSYKRKNSTDYELASLKSLAATKGPDIWSLPSDWFWDHQERITPLPADFFMEKKKGNDPLTQVKADYPEGIWRSIVGTDDQVYGLPSSVDLLTLYYNPEVYSIALNDYKKSFGDNVDETKYAQARQILRRAPTTWNELIAAEPYVTQTTNNQVVRSLVAMGTADNVPNSDAIVQLLMLQNGAKITSTDRRSALFQVETTTPSGGRVNPGVNALDFFASFSNPAKENYTWNASMPQALDAFAQGKVAMVIAYGDFGLKLKTKYPKFQFEVGPVPQIANDPLNPGVDLIRLTIESVTKTADHTSYAFAFLKGYTAKSSVQSLARDLKLTTPFKQPLEDSKSEFPNAQILKGQVVYKKDHTLFDDAFHQMIVDTTQNGISSSDAILTAAETINQLLDPKNAED